MKRNEIHMPNAFLKSASSQRNCANTRNWLKTEKNRNIWIGKSLLVMRRFYRSSYNMRYTWYKRCKTQCENTEHGWQWWPRLLPWILSQFLQIFIRINLTNPLQFLSRRQTKVTLIFQKAGMKIHNTYHSASPELVGTGTYIYQ